MLGYVFLSLALLAGVTKGYCGKRTSGYVSRYRDASLTNLVRMVLCIVIGLVVVLFSGDGAALLPTPFLLLTSALSGITTSIFVIGWLLSVKRGAYMLVDVFLMLGVLVPLLLGQALFDEQIKLTQWLGLAILLVAVLIMCSFNNSIKKDKLNLSSILLLTVCGLANGLTDFSQKWFVKESGSLPISVFNFYTYIFSALTLLAVYLFFLWWEPKETKAGENPFSLQKIFGYVAIMSVCLFANSYCKTLAAGYLDSALLYPLNQGAALILSSVMAATLFHERLTPKAIVGLVTAFVGLVVINVL